MKKETSENKLELLGTKSITKKKKKNLKIQYKPWK